MTEKKISGPIPDGPESSLSFEHFARERYLPFARERKRSWKTDLRYLERHVLPYLGASALADISEETLKDWMTRLEASGMSPSSCCRIFWLVKYMLNCAVRWRLLESDKAFKHASCIKEVPRRPAPLSMEDALKLIHILDEKPDNVNMQAIRLMLLTGACKSEILHARWEDVDLSRGLLSTSMTVTRRRRLIPLNKEAMTFIRSLKKQGDCPWLFPSSRGKPLSSLHYTWNAVRRQLGRPELRLQDLRHSFAHFLMNMGIQQTELRTIMGHYRPDTLALVKKNTAVNSAGNL